MDYPKLPPEKNRRRKLIPEDVEQIRWLVKEGVPRKEVAQQFKVSLATIDFWCWTDEQRKRHYARNSRNAKERGYDLEMIRRRQKEYRAYKRSVQGDVLRKFHAEQQKLRYSQKNARIRQRRLERAVELLRKHGRDWMEKRYRHLPDFLEQVYNYKPSAE